MILVGAVLLVLGLLLPVSFAYVLVWLGIAFLIIGFVLVLVGTVGHHPVGGRSHWW